MLFFEHDNRAWHRSIECAITIEQPQKQQQTKIQWYFDTLNRFLIVLFFKSIKIGFFVDSSISTNTRIKIERHRNKDQEKKNDSSLNKRITKNRRIIHWPDLCTSAYRHVLKNIHFGLCHMIILKQRDYSQRKIAVTDFDLDFDGCRS